MKIKYVWFNDTLGVNKYDWTWGNRKSSEQFPEIIFDKSGRYLVSLKISFTTDSSVNFSQIIVIPECEKLGFKTSIKSTNNNLIIKVIPNPTDNFINVHIERPANYKITIFDALGQITYNNIINGSFASIECKSLANGLYFIQISDGSDNYFSKFIKQ